MKKIICLLILLLSIAQNIASQNTEYQLVRRDSTPSVLASKKAKDKPALTKSDSFPVPNKAVLWSLLPGGGQIYNRKLWFVKLPIVYGGFIGGVYAVDFNTKRYRFLKEQYKLKVLDEPLDPSISLSVTREALLQGRDAAFKNLQQSYIFCGIWYVLSAAEAFTTAHLAHFDVKDDLSFRLKPSFESLPIVGNAVGLGVQFSF